MANSTCKTILIVDDEADIRDTVQQILEYEGFKVLTASNGQEALELVKTLSHPCLIFLDLMMPVMDGWEFAKAHNSDPDRASKNRVVVVTAFVEKADSIEAAGALRKPVDLEQLVSVARAHCQKTVAV